MKKLIFILGLIAIVAFNPAFASNDKDVNVEVVSPTEDVVFTMDMLTTAPTNDGKLVEGQAVVLDRMNLNKGVRVEATEWRDVPDGYGGAQIQEGYKWVPNGFGGGFMAKTGECRAISTGTIYNCSTGGAVE